MTNLNRIFWICWPGGLLLLGIMIALNPMLVTAASPMGISDHQAAPDAATVDAIQQAWQAAGKLGVARLSMAIDLFFIGIYGVGAVAGGLVFMGTANGWLRRLGLVAIASAALFVLTDYAETISQFIQVMQYRGSDTLSAIASGVRPLKSVVFLISVIALLMALIIRRITRTSA